MEERTIEITLQEYTELLQCKLRNEMTVKLLELELLYASSSTNATIKAILTGDAETDSERSGKGQESAE